MSISSESLALLENCSFCGTQRCDDEANFCTTCGRPLLVPSSVRSMDMGKTTANYDPYHPDWKPWREPTLLKKRSKPKKETFYNKNAWGQNVPRPSLKKVSDSQLSVNATEDRGNLVFSDHHEFGGVRFRGFTWKKPTGGLIRRRRKWEWKMEQNDGNELLPQYFVCLFTMC